MGPDRKAFPWPEIYRVGVVILGLTPKDLWDLTPRELALFLGETPSDPTALRTSLMTMMNQYPDNDHE